MEENLPQVVSKLQPVSFTTSDIRLTEGQKLLLALLKNKLKENVPVTLDDIHNLWCDSIDARYTGYGSVTYWNSNQGQKITTDKKTYVEYLRKNRPYHNPARQWFANNLGSCVLKGKLLALPQIEI